MVVSSMGTMVRGWVWRGQREPRLSMRLGNWIQHRTLMNYLKLPLPVDPAHAFFSLPGKRSALPKYLSGKMWLAENPFAAGGPAFKPQKPPQLRVPRPSRFLRTAGTTTAYTTGSVERTRVAPAASPPSLATFPRMGYLLGTVARQRWATRR